VCGLLVLRPRPTSCSAQRRASMPAAISMMQRPLVALDASSRGPYREHPSARVTPTRVHYRPGSSFWTLLLVLVITVPLAWAARRQLPGAQRTVSCTTVASRGTFRCTAWDRTTGDVRRMPCEDAQQSLDDQIDHAGVLSTPAITVVSTVSPVESTPIPAPNVYVGGLNTAIFPRVPRSSANDAKVAAEWNKIDRPADGTITSDSARALLAVCATAPPAEAEHRTVALMIVPRDDRGAALVLAVGVLLILLRFLFARSTVIEVDPNTSTIRLSERFGPFPRAPISVRLSDVIDVVIAHGAKGPLVGQRVELVLMDGSRMPLVSSYAPLSTSAHERTARALKSSLGLLAI
jgi:hypothetical protein